MRRGKNGWSRVCILALGFRLPSDSVITYLEAAALSVANVAIFMPTHMKEGGPDGREIRIMICTLCKLALSQILRFVFLALKKRGRRQVLMINVISDISSREKQCRERHKLGQSPWGFMCLIT